MTGDDDGTEIVWSITDEEALRNFDERPLILREAYGIRCDERTRASMIPVLKACLRKGYMEGQPVSRMAADVQEMLRGLYEMSTEQAEAITRTEILGTMGHSKAIALCRSGFREKMWFTANDGDVRPLHREMHGKIIDVNGVWVFSDGSRLKYPGDPEGPDHLVVNCRCVEVVVPDSHELLNPRR